MNKRYIDFVPTAKTAEVESKAKKRTTRRTPGARIMDVVPRTKKATQRTKAPTRIMPAKQASRAKKTTSVKTTPAKATSARTRNAAKVAPVRRSASARGGMSAKNVVPVRTNVSKFTNEKKSTLGEMEDLSRHFVKTDVAKRPLSQPAPRPKLSLIEKFNARQSSKAQKKEVEPKASKVVSRGTSEEELRATYRASDSPFINRGQVEKRPLSSTTVYTKKVVAPKVKKQEPVTIITKPEKQSHIGIVVAVILTIILGAAAGTVAFLLLPK